MWMEKNYCAIVQYEQQIGDYFFFDRWKFFMDVMGLDLAPMTDDWCTH